MSERPRSRQTHLEQIVEAYAESVKKLEEHTAANAAAIKAVIDVLIDKGIIEDFRPEHTCVPECEEDAHIASEQ